MVTHKLFRLQPGIYSTYGWEGKTQREEIYRGLESQTLSARAALGWHTSSSAWLVVRYWVHGHCAVSFCLILDPSLCKEGGLYSMQREHKETVCHSWRDGGHSGPELQWGAGATLWSVVTWLLPAKPIRD